MLRRLHGHRWTPETGWVGVAWQSRRGQTQHAPGSTRDQRRVQPGADGWTGNQMAFMESPDMTPLQHFSANTLEHVRVPELPLQRRLRSDLDREADMRQRFGPEGPGEHPEKSSAVVRRDMLQEQQDIDGLPWEVRWRRSCIPTVEEALQDIRDRFDLFILDPMEREQEWYLHWKDRMFRVQRDRMIWPQGYTDYLDHYDEHGRRRVLPSDQRWSDTSWKHLADVRYKDRLWLLEGEERKALHRSLRSQDELLAEEDKRQLELADALHGLAAGVIDLNPDQTYEALTGTADPRQIAVTKQKISAYSALQLRHADDAAPRDPVTGLPKANMEPLPTGISVEQASVIATRAGVREQKLAQLAETARQSGCDPVLDQLRRQLHASRAAGDQPTVHTQLETDGAAMQQLARKTPDVAAAEGFVELSPRPSTAALTETPELYHTPDEPQLTTMPAWYRDSLVQTEPLIRPYDLVHDPIETSDTAAFYTAPPLREEHRISYDVAPGDESAFDQAKMLRHAHSPELAGEFQPLPLYRDAAREQPATPPSRKSEVVRRERIARRRRQQLQSDPDTLLPSLPWETDSVTDPYRGVAEKDLVAFDRSALEQAWRLYRDVLRQAISEFHGLSTLTTQEQGVRLLLATAARFRDGNVGSHAALAPEQEGVLRLVFEGHTRQFLSDYYRTTCQNVADVQTHKAEADDLLRRAAAQAKLLGPSFVSFIQEMSARELDVVRRNPVRRYAILLQSKKHETIVRPLMNWVQQRLPLFVRTEYATPQQMLFHRDDLLRHLKTARASCPSRVGDVSDPVRDAAVEAVYMWCYGMVCFHAAEHLHRMYLHFAETRFRTQAEGLFEDANEWFIHAAKIGNGVVYAPLPRAEPPYEYGEEEFLAGEDAVAAEMGGRLEKAEEIWHAGSTKRWYTVLDETEYMWFNERRGRLQLALEVSERCLENLLKRTHPSIHPFPDRARVFLEGAPLTQETAEHLWLRHMGDIYWEHACLMQRQGRYQTAQDHRARCLNAYDVALRASRARLPPTWTAPLLTEAHYLMRAYTPGGDVAAHLRAVERVVDRLCALPEPRHWVDPTTTAPIRIALVEASVPAYGEFIALETSRRLGGWRPEETLLRDHLARRARGEQSVAELTEYLHTAHRVAQEVFRDRVRRWREGETAGSEEYYLWTHLYFTFRVYPESREEVAALWEMYEPAYRYIYTNTALAVRARGRRLMTAALRYLSQILMAGDAAQLAMLHKELTTVRERLVEAVDRNELDRSLRSIERHMQDATQPIYVYSTEMLQQEAAREAQLRQSPLTRSTLAAKEYALLQERQASMRAYDASVPSSPEGQHTDY